MLIKTPPPHLQGFRDHKRLHVLRHERQREKALDVAQAAKRAGRAAVRGAVTRHPDRPAAHQCEAPPVVEERQDHRVRLWGEPAGDADTAVDQ